MTVVGRNQRQLEGNRQQFGGQQFVAKLRKTKNCPLKYTLFRGLPLAHCHKNRCICDVPRLSISIHMNRGTNRVCRMPLPNPNLYFVDCPYTNKSACGVGWPSIHLQPKSINTLVLTSNMAN